MTQDIEEVKSFNLTLLEEIISLLKDKYGSKYNVKITKSDKVYTLCTDNFLIMFSIPDLSFYVSFMVGQSGQKVGQDMAIIMSILEYDEFSVMEDSWYDKEKEELVFGTEALESKQREMIKQKCPYCERIGTKEHFHETGICKYCEEKKTEMVWH